MQRIPVSKAREGMVLAKPVARDNGVVLMGEGTELDERLIEKLVDLDIQKIAVKGKPLGTLGDDKPLEQLLSELDERFSTNADDRMCMQIKDCIKQDCIRRKEDEEQ